MSMQYQKARLCDSREEAKSYVGQCDAEMEQRMETAVRSVATAPGVRLIGLTGPTCSGKTTAARRLTEFFRTAGVHVHVVSIDDFYYDKTILEERADKDPTVEVDYDSEDTIDTELLRTTAEALLSGKKTFLPQFDFHSGKRSGGKWLQAQENDIFLFEGIQILYPKVRAILEGADYRSVYICPLSGIETGGERFEPNEIRLLRRIVRDFRYRSAQPEFTFYLWQSVRANEEKNIFPYADRCNVAIDSSMPYEIGMLKPFLEELLRPIAPEHPFFGEAQQILCKLQNVKPVSADFLTEKSLYKEFI